MHRPGACWQLNNPCKREDCKKVFREAFADGISKAYRLVGECVDMPIRNIMKRCTVCRKLSVVEEDRENCPHCGAHPLQPLPQGYK